MDRVSDAARLESLAADMARVLGDVRATVEDWKKMAGKVREILADLERRPPPVGQAVVAETREFLQWLADNHFTFLGYRCHDLVMKDGDDALAVVPESGLGILRVKPGESLSTSFSQLPPRARAYAREKDLLIVTKANSRSTVHRPGYLDYIGLKRYDDRGEVCGEHRFLGLYTHIAYQSRPSEIPLLRRKVAGVQARAGYPAGGHAAKRLENILDTYPRDELFQIGEEELYAAATGILHLGERQRFRLFVRTDPFERFVSCLIYAPREHYTTELRRKWQAILTEAFKGVSTEFDAFLSQSMLARIHIVVRTTPGQIPVVSVPDLEARLAQAARRWEDDLRAAALERLGEARGNELARRFAGAFPAAYREDVPARNAVPDMEMAERVAASGTLGMSLYRPLEAAPGTLRFKLFHAGKPVPLSDSLPMLERMGLRVLEERPYRIAVEGGQSVWLHDFGLATATDADVEIDAVATLFEQAFGRVFAGEIESDDFNRLVLAARLAADEIVVLRAYAKYVRQIGFPLSQAFIEQTLAAHPAIARALVALFRLRFEPLRGGAASADAAEADAASAAQAKSIEAALDAVENLNEDRVLRQYLALILATTRTNFWRSDADGRRRTFLSFKLDPARVPGLPEPKPMFEIFVYSTRFEGVHLRGGKVARGGLRWSDRPEDFRTEVLGLVKAQMVKNAVIVPVGSKGRLRPQARARRIRPRSVHEGRRRLLPGLPARAARSHRQPRRRPGRAAAAGAPARRGRSVPRRRGRQGDGDVLRLRERHLGRVRVLARRRVRLRRLGRLRPQGDGHHRPGRVGVGEAPLPRARRRHPDDRLHRRRHRRHVGRRVRQRHAAVEAHQARGRVRPPAHLHRPGAESRRELRRANAAVRAAALLLGGLQPDADLGGRRRVAAQREVDPALPAGPQGARHRGGDPDADRARRRDPRARRSTCSTTAASGRT